MEEQKENSEPRLEAGSSEGIDAAWTEKERVLRITLPIRVPQADIRSLRLILKNPCSESLLNRESDRDCLSSGVIEDSVDRNGARVYRQCSKWSSRAPRTEYHKPLIRLFGDITPRCKGGISAQKPVPFILQI
jgi:hypothetical protein